MEQNKLKILDILKKNKLMVVSTLSHNGLPQSAVVAFCETSDLDILFGTSNKTRKYNNLQKSKQVSLVIGWNQNEKITIQYEGIAQEVKDAELASIKEIFLKKNPSSKKFAMRSEQRFFKIKPKWIRYSNLSKDSNEIFEINLS